MRGHRSVFAAVLTVAVAVSFSATPAMADVFGDRSHQQLAFVVQATDGHRLIELWDLDTDYAIRDMVDLGNRDAIQPDWSPDGERLIYSAQTTPGGPYAIFTSDPDGPNLDVHQLTFPVGVSGPAQGDFNPAWSPDSLWVAFTRTTDISSKIFWHAAGGGSLEGRVTGDPFAYEVEPSWMPDSRTVVFANRAFEPDPADPSRPAYHFQLVRALIQTFPHFATNITFEPATDFHTPSVSPDGTRVAASETFTNYDVTFSALVSLGPPVVIFGDNFKGDRNPDWSPDGTKIVADLFGEIIVTSEPGGSTIIDNAPGTDAAWRPPAPAETTPPLLTITPRLDQTGGWLAISGVRVDAQDASGVAGVTCTLDGAPIEVFGSSVGTTFIGKVFVEGPEGFHTLNCTAVDTLGNSATASADLMVDFDAPRLGDLSVTPNISPLGTAISVGTTYEENGSGLALASAELTTSSLSTGAIMNVSGSSLSESITPFASGIYTVTVRAFDNRGQSSSAVAPSPVVVFDPSRGSVSGSGWIVPLGSTSDAGDTLPSIDGRSKASFDFSARYFNTKKLTATTPTGSLTMSYGSKFKLQSTALTWLVLDGATARFQGIGTIKGQSGIFTFQVELLDAPTDRFELRVWPIDSNPFTYPPLYQATGDAGGQIQVIP